MANMDGNAVDLPTGLEKNRRGMVYIASRFLLILFQVSSTEYNWGLPIIDSTIDFSFP